MFPSSGFNIPVNILIVVDFPAPLWPNKQNISFLKRESPNPLTTFLFPKLF